jgi:pimeloyl-ACP methyl ester carboxylesterase
MSACTRSRRIYPVLVVLMIAPLARAIDAERVAFETYDNVTIVADYYAPKPTKTGAPMVILVHMYRSDRSAWRPLIEPLHEAGFAALAIDLRGHGDSATEEARNRVAERDPAVFEAMYYDLRAAYDWLAKQEGVDRSRFALVGASVGCSVSLRYAVKDRSLDALVCLSPGANYLGLDSKQDIMRIRGRKLWLVAADDLKERAGVDALALLGEGIETTLFPGNVHGTRLFGVVPHLEQRIAGFLKKSVAGPTDTTVYGSVEKDIYHLPGSGWIERISPRNMRHYSSPEEAEARGLRKAKSRGPHDKPRKKDGG